MTNSNMDHDSNIPLFQDLKCKPKSNDIDTILYSMCNHALKILVLIISVIIMWVAPSSATLSDQTQNNVFSTKDKFAAIMYETAIGAAAISYWGFNHWDWGTQSAHCTNEGWLRIEGGTGGSDKFGHLFSGFVISDFVNWRLKKKGFDRKTAAKWGAGTSMALMTLIEIGDSTSDYGWSMEDFTMDTIGVMTSYFLNIYPKLDEKIDLRVEYWPSPGFSLDGDVVADYSGMKHLVALKCSGFHFLNKTPLKYFELHAGYYTRGMRSFDKGHFDEEERNFYIAVGVNINELLGNKKPNWIKTFFTYYQPPNTYLPAKLTIE